MESIYKPKTEKVVSVWNALSEYQKELYPDGMNRFVDTDLDIMEAMGFDGNTTEFDKLLESVDVAQLSSPKDIPVRSFVPYKLGVKPKIIPIPQKASRFQCIQRVLARKTEQQQRNIDVKLRYNRHKYMKKKQDLESSHDLVPFKEMLLILRFYEPFKYKPGRRLGHPKFNQEFYVLSSQYLTELKDKIYCHCDSGPFYEISENPKQKPSEPSSQSGFFFITDTFYNDLRDASNKDYSSVIQKWAERQGLIGELTSKSMEETRFGDLKFRLGYPQVYQHQGNCEHLFVVSDCRLLAATDILSRARYPWLNCYGFSRDVPCNICGHCQAQFVVHNSNRHIFDPAYVCETCLNTYHYVDGQKIGEFNLYEYSQTLMRTNDEPMAPSCSQTNTS
ncbi:snRNA-activating protein complex subunit 3 [Anopheles nili]|uniref:snRNA-activating protein complex subunit 3 n=1 Tax=Anopheles nili TaxID=185578 RepID=UPI00237AFEF2|nr:snRNA-activating protein complex subunit 3 [Anopheles nili]